MFYRGSLSLWAQMFASACGVRVPARPKCFEYNEKVMSFFAVHYKFGAPLLVRVRFQSHQQWANDKAPIEKRILAKIEERERLMAAL